MAIQGSQSRRDRLRVQQEEQARKQRRLNIIIWSGVVVVVVALVASLAFGLSRAMDRPDLSAAQTFRVSANHTEAAVTYEQTPPAGGDHHPAWLNCGVYNQPVPEENAVHSLEHGAVWVTYNPDLPEADVEVLRSAIPSTYMLLSPHPGVESVAASAWGVQLQLDGADDPRLAEFIRQYRMGPQTPEPGAACTGALDAPGRIA